MHNQQLSIDKNQTIPLCIFLNESALSVDRFQNAQRFMILYVLQKGCLLTTVH